jgi:hypothetical protein
MLELARALGFEVRDGTAEADDHQLRQVVLPLQTAPPPSP